MMPPEAELAIRVKAELRKRLRAVRRTAPLSSCNERSAKIIAALEAMPEILAAKRVALFWPIEDKHEVDLRAFDASLRKRGVEIAYPQIIPDSGVMTFRMVTDPAAMQEQGYGFSEPDATLPEATALDVIVVPALALDPRGSRIGYGAGYYDRAMPRFSPPAVKIGVVFDYQVLAEVPTTEHDVPVDFVVTDVRVLQREV